MPATWTTAALLATEEDQKSTVSDEDMGEKKESETQRVAMAIDVAGS